MAQSQRPSYRLNLNRNPTQKWAEAQSVDYEGDDWGDDNYDDYSRPEPEPVSAGPQRHPGWGGQGGGHVSQRSFTNPALAMGPGRQSLDRDEERRHFSAGGYDPRYIVQNTTNYSQREGSFEHDVRDYLNQPPLQLNTEFQNQPRYQNISGSRIGAQADTHGLPQSAPGGHFPQQMSSSVRRDQQDTSDIQLPQEQQDHGQSGIFPRDIEQQTALSQEQGIPQAGQGTGTAKSVLPATQSSPDDPKPLPFPRPADIYKRVEEEREKERRSQESSRPSLDSVSERTGGSPSRPADSTFHNIGRAPSEEPERPRRVGPVLDTVDEREGEYGPSPTSTKAIRSPFTPSTRDSIISSGTGNVNRQGPDMRPASSVYTDRPDPVSASSITSTPFHLLSATRETPISESSPFDNPKASPSNQPPLTSYPENHTEEGNPDLPQFDRAAPQPLATLPASIKDNAERDVETNNRFEPSKLETTQTQPPHEYKSVVQQAFDAENNPVLSPSSTRETIPRSSTASTSDISPIIGRKQDISNDENSMQQVPAEIVSKETAPLHDRSGSVTTLTPTTSQADNTILPATTFVPPSRRDNKSPNFEETKVKRPLSVEIPVAPEAQHGVLSTVTTSATPIQDRTANAIHPAEPTSAAHSFSPPKQPGPQTALVPPPTSRTMSEDWQEWQAQRRHFNAKHGIQDSDTASPAISSPISRSESPVKGTVKNIAGRIEGNSGRSSPVVNDAPDSQSSIGSKPQHLRNESFRPAIPGGWLSYTNSASGRETPESHAKPTPHPLVQEHNRNESTESIPTATAPRHWQPSAPGPIEAAFAAAAAAGSAMVGAFSGPGMSRDTPQYSEVDSDDDDDSSVPSRSRAPEFSQTRDFATEPVQTQTVTVPVNTAVSPEAFTGTAHGGSPNDTDNPVDFPAPLRTNKLSENKQPSPRISAPSMAATGDGHNPEQLQYDIVQSLTPKASRIDGSEPSSNQTPVKPIESDLNLPRQPSTTSTRDDVLPQEYSSYWDEQYPSTRKSDHTNEATMKQTTPQMTRPPIPVTTIATGSPQAEPRPFLDQRYSWETGYNQSKGSVPSGPAFAKGIATDRPSTPPSKIQQPPSIISPPSPIIHRIEEEEAHTPVSRDTAPLPSPSKSTTSSFPQAKTDFKQILSIKEPADRIRAFDENRRLYAQSSGLLEQWLSSMKTPEHADVFRTARLPSAQPAIVSNANRPSPRREVTTSSGTKQMQEDGKRLLAAAGRVGTATKGFFGKTKDKLRNASSGEKVAR